MRTCSKCGLRCYSVRDPPICQSCNVQIKCFDCGQFMVISPYGSIGFSVCNECKEKKNRV